MALASTAFFASFDRGTGDHDLDISPVLGEAIYFDLNLLGEGVSVDFGSPATQTQHYWDDEDLNPDTVTLSASIASNGTSASVTTGQGARSNIGDLLYATASGSTEVMQITAITGDVYTVTRAFNSTSAGQASIATGGTLARISVEQEGSDIGSDKSRPLVVYSNSTQILRGGDVLITGTQAAVNDKFGDFLLRQMKNRAIELKIQLARGVLYGEPQAASAVGSDSTYRTFGGLRYWARDKGGVVDSLSSSFAYSVLNSINKSIVDKGKMPDTLVVGTDLAQTIANFDNTNRRLYESDKQAGYTVNELMLGQGNSVRVVVDGRVKAGDGFLYVKDDIRVIPLIGRGMVMIAATDFADAKKRRILGEWTTEVHHPECVGHFYNKS